MEFPSKRLDVERLQGRPAIKDLNYVYKNISYGKNISDTPTWMKFVTETSAARLINFDSTHV